MALLSQSRFVAISDRLAKPSICMNDRRANPIRPKFISVAYPVKVSAVFPSTSRLISKNYRLANPIKNSIIFSASSFDGQPPRLPHYSIASYASSGNDDFYFDENDLVSEKSLWDLYERWMRDFKISRDPYEKQKHFNFFKKMVSYVYSYNKLDFIDKMGLDETADFKCDYEYDPADIFSVKPHLLIPVPLMPHLPPHATTSLPSPTHAGKSSFGFDFEEKDLSSEESLWELYNRWMCYFKIARHIDELEKHFIYFKKSAKYVHEFNKLNVGFEFGLNQFSDSEKLYQAFSNVSDPPSRLLPGSPTYIAWNKLHYEFAKSS